MASKKIKIQNSAYLISSTSPQKGINRDAYAQWSNQNNIGTSAAPSIPSIPTSNLLGWFVGETGITLSSGTSVSAWSGQGSYAITSLVQATTDNQPTKDTTTLAGKTGVRFDSTGPIQSLTSPNDPGSPPSLTQHIVLYGRNPVNGTMLTWIKNRQTKWHAGGGWIGDGYWSNNTGGSQNAMHILSLRSVTGGSPDGLFQTYLDGVSVGTTHDSGQGVSGGGLLLGGYVPNGWVGGDFTIYAIALYSSNQSTTDFDNTISALKSFYGIS